MLPSEAIAPLLDMASSSDPRLLSEVASMLAIVAQEPGVAEELQRSCSFSALQHLQQSSDFGVALPTSRMLACM